MNYSILAKASPPSATRVAEKASIANRTVRKPNHPDATNVPTVPKELLSQLGIFHSTIHSGTIGKCRSFYKFVEFIVYCCCITNVRDINFRI